MECVMEQQPACDLQAMDKKFKGGSCTSIVSVFILVSNP